MFQFVSSTYRHFGMEYYNWYIVAACGAVLLYIFYLVRSNAKLTGLLEKPVFITGCDSGFGRLLALSLDSKGIPVYAGCFLERTLEELSAITSPKLKTVYIDVTKTQSVKDAAEFVRKDLGAKALWGIVNNAGIVGTLGPFEWTSKQDCQRALDVNLLGMYDVTLAFLPLIKRGNRGRIVNMSSAMGRITFAAIGYAISKFAVEAFSDGLSYEMKPFNITVHMLEPGSFRTPLSSPEAQVRNLLHSWERASEEIREEYGGREYFDKYVRYTEVSTTKSSTRTHLVVEAYEHALFAVHPQYRYYVGWDSKLVWIPLSFCPLMVQMAGYRALNMLIGLKYPQPRNSKNKGCF